VIEFVISKGGFEYAQNCMKEYQLKATEILLTMTDNTSRQSLLELLDFVIERKK
jgi:octaprenyl-diphosphate synthase